jgi:hypothetical protein
MKGNIKKLSVLVGVPVIALFMMVGMASADPPHHYFIQGVYAVTGLSTCSPVLAGGAPVSPGLMEGDYTFWPNGNVKIRNGFIRNFPPGPTFDVRAEFKYTVTREGRITFEYPNGGFQVGVLHEDGYFEESFRVSAGPSHGVISPDGNMITISCGPPVGPIWVIVGGAGGAKVPDSDMWCITSVTGMRIR